MNVKALIKHTKLLEEEIAQLTKTKNENKALIQSFFDKRKLKTIDVESMEKGDIPLVAMKVEKCFIDYDMDKLQEKLDKQLFNKIVIKNYEVADMKGLIPILQQAGITPKDFKQYIRTIMQPNKEALKQLYALGEITKKDLEGCYTARIEKYIQIKEKKGDTN